MNFEEIKHYGEALDLVEARKLEAVRTSEPISVLEQDTVLDVKYIFWDFFAANESDRFGPNYVAEVPDKETIYYSRIVSVDDELTVKLEKIEAVDEDGRNTYLFKVSRLPVGTSVEETNRFLATEQVFAEVDATTFDESLNSFVQRQTPEYVSDSIETMRTLHVVVFGNDRKIGATALGVQTR